ncbi:MAG TPA: HAD-IA family hydrolase [Terracidiphilus sp.]|nr:HAD-IA family hydrolase [Terracidiphilus sp.]
MTLTATERARRIKIILFDVDGVLTDGTIWLVPGPAGAATAFHDHLAMKSGEAGFGVYSTTMMEAKGYSAHDGAGISLARIAGLKCGVITKRISETVATRMRDLKMDYVYMGQAFKMKPIREIMEKEEVTLDEIAYVGDDVVDLPALRSVGLAIAPANAREQVKAEAHYITPHAGGCGAGRDAVDFILDAKGILNDCIERMIDESNPISPTMDIGNSGDQA